MKDSLVKQYRSVMSIRDLHTWEDDVKEWCAEEELNLIIVLDILTA